MPDSNSARTTELSSSRSLFRSTLLAAAVAIVLLVTVVLPAEYGVDPTRVGRLLGLTPMGKIKVALAREAAVADSVEAAARQTTAATPMAPSAGTGTLPVPSAARNVPPVVGTPAANSPSSTDVSEIVLRPNEGKEIKLVMRKGARVNYSWGTDRGVVNFDTHADAPGIKYHGYAKGTGKESDEGVLVAAFDGAHGWFWRNRGRTAVVVTLRTTGDYQGLKRVK
ncbi:MAG TPA: hypothetical protein VNJ04_01430 [Gemmatimonadaceae bacterium]|nr:hypothetical protein [Gemmatimonadaceae bacterium]